MKNKQKEKGNKRGTHCKESAQFSVVVRFVCFHPNVAMYVAVDPNICEIVACVCVCVYVYVHGENTTEYTFYIHLLLWIYARINNRNKRIFFLSNRRAPKQKFYKRTNKNVEKTW